MSHQQPTDCDRFAEMISAYFDNQLGPDQRQQLEAHLHTCPNCTRRLADYQAIRNAIAGTHAHPPSDLTAVVFAQLERDQLLTGMDTLARPTTGRRIKALKALAVAAMIALIVSGAVFLLKSDWLTPPPERELTVVDRDQPVAKAAKTSEGAAIKPDHNAAKGTAGGAVTALAEPLGVRAAGKPAAGRPVSTDVGHAGKADDVSRTAHRRAKLSPGLPVRPITREAVSEKKTGTADARFAYFDNLPASRIQIRVPDAPSWMYARDKLLATFHDLGLAPATASRAASRPNEPENEFYTTLPRRPAHPDTRFRTTILVQLAPGRAEHFNQAIDRLDHNLRLLVGATQVTTTTRLAYTARAPSLLRRLLPTTATAPASAPMSRPSPAARFLIDLAIQQTTPGTPTSAPTATQP